MAKLSVSRANLAHMTGLAVTTIEYIEDGAYQTLPDVLISVLEVANAELEKDYYKYQMTSRLQANLPQELPPSFPELSPPLHPHQEWRMMVCGMDINPYCKTLCVPRWVVQNLEKGQPQFPLLLEKALVMATSPVVTALVDVCNNFSAGV
jgi:DNA-binding XRE family transcriptional regulator